VGDRRLEYSCVGVTQFEGPGVRLEADSPVSLAISCPVIGGDMTVTMDPGSSAILRITGPGGKTTTIDARGGQTYTVPVSAIDNPV
jgi:hypothetical protein